MTWAERGNDCIHPSVSLQQEKVDMVTVLGRSYSQDGLLQAERVHNAFVEKH